tara:strand:- start:2014 stop:2307 length:294 start_codon:yes stop_codon:yes gene_type:complete
LELFNSKGPNVKPGAIPKLKGAWGVFEGIKDIQMSNQIIRDARGKVIGMMQAKPSSIIEARDANGRFLGSYNPQTNITLNNRGQAIGTGNLLGRLLY